MYLIVFHQRNSLDMKGDCLDAGSGPLARMSTRRLFGNGKIAKLTKKEVKPQEFKWGAIFLFYPKDRKGTALLFES